MSRTARLARSLSPRRSAACGAIFAGLITVLSGCGGTGTTLPSRLAIDAVRARAAAAPGDAALQRELASAELLLEGGDPARVPDALARAARLAPEDARVRYLQALEDDGKGRLDAAFEAYLGALGKASTGADAISQAIAEASLSALADLVDVVPRGRERLRAVLEPLHAAPASLGLAARHHLAELLVDQAWRRGERDTVRAIAADLGCPAEWRVAGPFGPRELLGFDEPAPAEGRGPLADRYDLGPGRGTRPTRTLEPRGCGVNLGGGAVSAAGTTVAEARITVARAGRYMLRLETPNSVELHVDGARIARLDARRDPLGRTSLHTLDLSAGEHELEVKLTTRHPNPILVVSLAPAVPADAVALPGADAASPLEQYLAASLAIARGDVVAARERAHPIAEKPDATAP